jgi:prephenate dehydrogenase
VAIGLIGYGRFGKFIAKHLGDRTDVLVFDSANQVRSSSKRIHHAPLKSVASQQVVLLAVPVSAMRTTLRNIRPFLQPSTLVIDVCAVKVKPVEWMRAMLPKQVHILGAHPLFGPDSARDSFIGHQVYLTPVRIPAQKLRHVIREVRAAGLLVKTVSPREHDKLMAETLFLTQYIGRYVRNAGFRRHVDSTNSYDALIQIVKIASNDTPELFRDMVKYNPFAAKTVAKFDRAQRKLKKELAD